MRGTVHSREQFLQKFLLTMIKAMIKMISESAHVSAPSYDSIITSKGLLCFLIPGSLSLYTTMMTENWHICIFKFHFFFILFYFCFIFLFFYFSMFSFSFLKFYCFHFLIFLKAFLLSSILLIWKPRGRELT